MSDACSSLKNITKLTGRVTEKLSKFFVKNIEDSGICFNDHAYLNKIETLKNPNHRNVNTLKSNNQNCESEVRFKENWLFLHLGLQQQNKENPTKKKSTYMLENNNEMLRDHINCLQSVKYSSSTTIKNYSCDNMTQDATHLEDDKNSSQKAMMNNCINHCGSLNDLLSYDSILKRSRVHTPCDIDMAPNLNLRNNIDDKCLLKHNKSELVVNNYQETLESFQRSIRRTRVCSGSSLISNNTSVDEPETSRKRKKRNTIIKDDKILTSTEPYVTQTSEIEVLGLVSDLARCEATSTNNLEVPQWRQRIHTSLYSMEGTENLDDDVFNKRHMRLETDERRRKRWDVQRIREQRITEKLKLRQERILAGRVQDKTKSVVSLWPNLDDIKYIEVSEELPVSAFGAPVPRLTPSEFTLSWDISEVEPNLKVLDIDQSLQQVEELFPVKKGTPGRKRKNWRKTKR